MRASEKKRRAALSRMGKVPRNLAVNENKRNKQQATAALTTTTATKLVDWLSRTLRHSVHSIPLLFSFSTKNKIILLIGEAQHSSTTKNGTNEQQTVTFFSSLHSRSTSPVIRLRLTLSRWMCPHQTSPTGVEP